MASKATSSKRPRKLLYAEGAVLINRVKSFAAGAQPAHVIAFADLFRTERGQPPDFAGVSAALFLTFCYSTSLLKPLVDHNVRLVIGANFEAPLGEPEPPALAESHVRVISSPNPRIKSTFHPKLFLLRFPDFLRVVVGSGNLFAEDWTAFGNCFYARDFRLLREALPAPQSQFHAYLRDYLQQVFGEETAAQLAFLGVDLLRYDMDAQCPLLVGSVPGQYALKGEAHGFALLRNLMEAHPPQCRPDPAQLRITCLTSSLGAVNLSFLHTLAHCLVPALPLGRQALKSMGAAERAAFVDMFHVVFPTEEHVERAKAAPDCLFFRRATYEGFSFERGALSLYAGSGSVKGDDCIVPHYKVLIVTFARDFGVTDDTLVYLGSHNLTKPAWGKSSNFDQNFMVWNYELGVLFPPRKDSAAAKREVIDRLGFAFPPQRYSHFDTPFFNQL